MTIRNRIKSCGLAVLVGAAACLFLNCDNVTSISRIHHQLPNYVNKQVTVTGDVTDAGDYLLVKYYKVMDKTGEIYVVSRGTLPKVGQHVRVQGMVRQKVAILGYTLTAIDELELKVLR